ncbi:IS256 family transposase [Melioribacter sp. Ez-97]|uniref:IS256 family transposase n=1 Tax=Melioribacter sp. Ez-97 TaxID=3423434 RepID=UPI003ED9D6D3
MELTEEIIKQLKSDLSKAKTYDDLMGKNGAIKKLISKTLETMLQEELTEHLGYERYSPAGRNSGNNRNGKTYKTLRNDNGEIDIAVPRDRNGTFDPIIVKKYERTLGAIEDKIISMYAKGMTTRDIQSHLQELYGLDISASLISQITDKIIDLAKEWHNRPVESIYPIVFFDAIHYKVTSEGKVINKAAYTCLSLNMDGRKDLLGLWVSEAEGANFWLTVLTELKNRGLEKILIACVDGLKGFPEAINTVFPNTEIQQCIIHLIRNTLKYIASKDQKQFMQELRKVYSAPTEEAALIALDKLEESWGKKYSLAIKTWRNNWTHASTFFKYPDEIRKIIYTTNAVEAVHRQFRKVTKTRSIFPNDDALKKMLFLAYRDLSKKWTVQIQNWAVVISHLSVIFEDQLKDVL